MAFLFAAAYGGVATLTFDIDEAQNPDYVLVFPFYKGNLILTKHHKRGWELPGGTIEPGEQPAEAAVREVYEETGAAIHEVEWLGQYTITGQKSTPFVKSIYIANVAQLHPIPLGYETTDMQVCDVIPCPDEIQKLTEFSPILKDDVYRYVIGHIQQLQHRFYMP